MEDQTFKYVEVFNSISSVYGWIDKKPTCVGGIPPYWDYENIEYSMDVDTFVLDSTSEGDFAAHFNKGGQYINLRIGANQDSIITNFMVVSVDTKSPTFDIPDQPELVACTPANFQADYENYYDARWCDNGLPHTFAIRIQNWGDDMTPPVIVKNTIPENMEYVQGSTEYATEFITVNDKRRARKWMEIPDNNGGFPLVDGFKIADTTTYCPADTDHLSCENLIMVRYQATVKQGIMHMERIENIAEIYSSGFTPYKTNHGIPFSMVDESGDCVKSPEMIDLSECGGFALPEICKTDLDCESGEYCDHKTGKCMPYPPPPDFDRYPDEDNEETDLDSDSFFLTDEDETESQDNSFHFGCSNFVR